MTLIGRALPSSGVLCCTVWLRWTRQDAKPEKIRQGSSHRRNPILSYPELAASIANFRHNVTTSFPLLSNPLLFSRFHPFVLRIEPRVRVHRWTDGLRTVKGREQLRSELIRARESYSCAVLCDTVLHSSTAQCAVWYHRICEHADTIDHGPCSDQDSRTQQLLND
jgi:hypothetical protein